MLTPKVQTPITFDLNDSINLNTISDIKPKKKVIVIKKPTLHTI